MSKHIHRNNRKLRCCKYPNHENEFTSEEAALHLATARNQFVAFDGIGIGESILTNCLGFSI